MKRQITLWMAVIMLFGTIVTFAQKPFAGTIIFEMSAEGINDPNIAAELAAISQEVTIMGNNTKTAINQGGVDIINITNGDYNLATTIIGIPGYGKYYVEKDADAIKKTFELAKIDFNYTDETMTILDYTCKKVVLTITDLESDEESHAILWVTDDLMLGENINFSQYPGLKGYPLRTEIEQDLNGTKYTLVQYATSITPSKKVKESNFLRPSDSTPMKDAPADLKAALGIEEE